VFFSLGQQTFDEPRLEEQFAILEEGSNLSNLTITIDIDALAAAIAERLPSSEPQRWFSLVEAAEYTRCSERFLHQRLDEIPHSRLGRKLLFDRQGLDSWLNNHRRG
jgi:excisionase family DNA binding protein